MHDVLEGLLPLLLYEITNYCIKSKFFTLAQLNHGILNFYYGSKEVKDKPGVIDALHLKKKKLRQSAIQIWLLAVSLRLLIGGIIRRNETWHCFTTFLEVMGRIFSSSISVSDVEILSDLIFEFLTDFKYLFPPRRTGPKMHFLVHYPRYILLYGPLLVF